MGSDYVESLAYNPTLQYSFIGLQGYLQGEIWVTTDGGETFTMEQPNISTYIHDLDYSAANQRMFAGITYGGQVWTRNDYAPSSSSMSASSCSESSSSSSNSSSSSTSVAPIEVNLIGGPNWGGTSPGGWHENAIGDSGSVTTVFHDGAVPASPNRCVVATICARLNIAGNPTQATLVTLGGRTLTTIFEVNVDDRTFNSLYMWTGYLLEVDIALMVGATFAVTWSNQPDEGTHFAYSGYENVDQVTPILDFNSNSLSNTKTVTTGPYTYGGDDQPIVITMNSRQSDGLYFSGISGYTYVGLNFQDYGYDDQSGVGSATSRWGSRLMSKTYHNLGSTDNATGNTNNFCGMIAGAIVLKAG